MGRPVGSKNKPKTVTRTRRTRAVMVIEERERIKDLLNKSDRTPIECCECLIFSFRRMSELDEAHNALKERLEFISGKKGIYISEIKRLTNLLTNEQNMQLIDEHMLLK